MANRRSASMPADEPDPSPAGSKPGQGEPAPAVFVEQIPSIHGQISALGSANAPFIHFDGVPSVGLVNGVARIALTAERTMLVLPDNSAIGDHVIVAHLRCSLVDLAFLRAAIERIEKMAADQVTAAVAMVERPPGSTAH